MPVTMVTATATSTDRLSSCVAGEGSEAGFSSAFVRLTGLVVVAVVPAVFWVSVLIAVETLTSVEFSTYTLTKLGFAIAAFIGAVCAPMLLKRKVA